MKIKHLILIILFITTTVTSVHADDLMDGLDALAHKSYRKAFEKLKSPAEQGHEHAQFLIASMYQFGTGTIQNDDESFKWYRLSAEQGHDKSQFRVGLAYLNGKGIIKDDKEAVKWIRMAAEQNHQDAPS